MTITVALEHRTSYRFDRTVRASPHVVRLRPAPHCRTPIPAYSLLVECEGADAPEDHFCNWLQDPFGNFEARLVFPEPLQSLTLTVGIVADMTVINPFDFFVDESAERFPFHYEPALARDLAPYLAVEPAGPRLSEWLRTVQVHAGEELSTVDHVAEVNRRVCKDVAYTVRFEAGVQTPDTTLGRALGSCRDTAWLLVQALRHQGLASRFVSGYLVQLTADQPASDGPAGPTADFTDLHAWAEVYVPGAGWLGLDPTSGMFAGEGHIPLAATPDPASAAPVTGATEPCGTDLEFSNSVCRIREDPRVTLPYTDAQWEAIDELGHAVDRRLRSNDVRLTVGGEPTFVSIDDMDGEQWNTAADGETKRDLSWDLARRLAARFATGALVQHGQGKWYPGEPLPRWQISVAWRPDGPPLWHDPALLVDPHRTGTATFDQAHDIARDIGLGLDIGVDAWLPAYEPDDVACGWVLPLYHRAEKQRPGGGRGWTSSHWDLPDARVVLARGDSPMGFRLPLDSLPEGTPITALCVELRDGRIHVFLPPTKHFDHAVDLVAVVEAAAAAHAGVVVEGHSLPSDPRVRQLVVAPDPGVIEVNVHPASSWAELVDITTTLHAEARQVGLGTEKFQLDGTHTGTGGGNHITLGGPTPADSPLLRRPDLLRSLVTFWQHHPSLSYLFSGRFVGPTSQAPRVDEGRAENLYELEIAFAELGRLAVDPNPRLVDRLLRHLLVDITGNTHRAEFCIDKLFSPDNERGRLGLLELRAFEMPPHPQMSLVQGLLVRSLVSRFWDVPYFRPLVRWGTELHDRFLLPWYVAADIADVVDDLRRNGYPFDPEWLAPFLEFRFPRIGSVQIADTTIELRAAIEPWNVLGEEVTNTGTTRYVDSSIERLQVLVQGLTGDRHAVTCNGAPVPLRPTGTPGTWVAGVRYRAWQPSSALHPTIGVHGPLVFDLVDRWSSRSIGGCTYHVVHPGGRAYEHLPVNANEAEARRAGRFEPMGHTAGPLDAVALAMIDRAEATECPRTLDLRRTLRSRPSDTR